MNRSHHFGRLLACTVVTALAAKAEAAGPPFLYGLAGNNIVVYAADGTSTNLAYADEPDALAFNPSGTLFASLDDGGYVAKYTASGSSSIFAGPYYATDGLAIDTSGNVFVAQTYGQNNIYKITPGGSSSLFAHLSGTPYALEFDNSGNLYASVDNSIVKITSSGMQSTFITGLAAPRDIAFDASGDLYVANDLMTNGNVQEFSPTGNLIGPVASGLSTPYSLAFDNAGDLFIGSLGGAATIEEITPSGNVSNFAIYTYGGGALAIAPAYAPSVPEPASVALVTIGATSLLLRRRRAVTPNNQ